MRLRCWLWQWGSGIVPPTADMPEACVVPHPFHIPSLGSVAQKRWRWAPRSWAAVGCLHHVQQIQQMVQQLL